MKPECPRFLAGDAKLKSSREINALRKQTPQLWINPRWRPARDSLPPLPYGMKDIEDAARRLERFAPLLMQLFPELDATGGIIESELRSVPHLARTLSSNGHFPADSLWLKADHELPVAGSIKARGGIYAVLCLAEKVAIERGGFRLDDDYHRLGSPFFRSLFKEYELSVGSTGNLGFSIGIMGAAMGFRVTVHMSVEAKEWKKVRLRKRGVQVVEHASDYTSACASARDIAARDPRYLFIDDERSVELLLGYSVAILRLKDQFLKTGVTIGTDHPLFLYLPCGVGGAPGGITFAARHVFGDHAHCFFAEPVQAPCMFLGLLTKQHDAISVYDLGLNLATDADGLAVARPSRLVGRLVSKLVSGCFTVSEKEMYQALLQLYETERIEVEPSAATGCLGPQRLLDSRQGRQFLQRLQMNDRLNGAIHLIWTTGGSMAPSEQHAEFRKKAVAICTAERATNETVPAN